MTAPTVDPDCYACEGTGRIVGFGCTGKPCPCRVLCVDCGEDIGIPYTELDWDVSGLVTKRCATCIGAAATEEGREP